MTRVTVYNLTHNFHFVYIIFIIVSQVSFSTPHILHLWLAVSDHKWDQKFKSKMHSIVLLTHVRTLDTVYNTETVSKMLCYSETRQRAVSNVCVNSVAHHKYKTSVTFTCIHKVQLFTVRTETAKDSHRKKYKILIQEANNFMQHSP